MVDQPGISSAVRGVSRRERSATWWMNPRGLPAFWMCPWPIAAGSFLALAIWRGFSGDLWGSVGFAAAVLSMLCAYGMEVAFRMMATNAHDLLDTLYGPQVPQPIRDGQP